MKVTRFLIALTLVWGSQLATAQAQTFGSQILMAHNANLILIGEVVYLTKPDRFPSTVVHYHSQVVVFRVREVIKGSYSEKFVKVAIAYSPERQNLSESDFGHGRRFILLLERQWPPDHCLENESPTGFEKYAKVSCYFSYLQAVIEANDNEVEAVKVLVNNSKKI